MSCSSKVQLDQAPVAHACNSSYSGGRDKEDRGLKTAWQIISKTVSQKNPSQKRGLVEQGERERMNEC
jgi:hypothetical protein